MAEIRNLTRNGETFYPLTHIEGVLDPEGEYIGNYVDNPEFVYVKTDNEGRILFGIKSDGDLYLGYGVPSQIIEYIKAEILAVVQEELKKQKIQE